jgi:hypothetical protein
MMFREISQRFLLQDICEELRRDANAGSVGKKYALLLNNLPNVVLMSRGLRRLELEGCLDMRREQRYKSKLPT